MPLTIFDYLIIFTASMLGGMILAQLILFLYNKTKKKPLALSFIGEKLAMGQQDEGKYEERVKSEFVPVLSELRIIESALKLTVFTPDELSRLSGESRARVDAWLRSAVNQDIISKLSDNVYSISLSRVLQEKLAEISRLISETIDYENQYASMKLHFSENEVKKLANWGIKNLIYVGWDDDLGPKIDYFLFFTRFVKKVIEDPAFLARIMVSGEISVVIETEEGFKIVISKLEVKEEDKVNPNIVIAEVTANADIEQVKSYLQRIKEIIEKGVGEQKSIEQILKEALR